MNRVNFKKAVAAIFIMFFLCNPYENQGNFPPGFLKSFLKENAVFKNCWNRYEIAFFYYKN